MNIHKLQVGPMQANCYILECEKTKSAAVIDPGDEAGRIINTIGENELNLDLILNTHGHIDHIAANGRLKDEFAVPLCIHSADADMLVNPQKNLSFFIGVEVSSPPADRFLEDGDVLRVGELEIKVIHTPGHSPGSICLLGDDFIFTGDLLFAGGIGRYDFPGSSYEKLVESLQAVIALESGLMVYPGHGPETTIGRERRTNPFLQ